jgi:hypothetical protein
MDGRGPRPTMWTSTTMLALTINSKRFAVDVEAETPL